LSSIGAARRLGAGQAFAHHKRKSIFKGRVLTVDIAIGQALIAAGELGGQVLGDTAHP
jgi:hypothetical protein